MKKILLMIIDGLASRVVRPALEQGRLPSLGMLVDAGDVYWNGTSIFPSITPAATASLVTGAYPASTGILGAYFYDQQQGRVHYYGDDVWAIWRRGISTFFEDFLVRLNRDQLRIETIFQTVERAGKRSGCLNYLWYRGDITHQVHVPWLLRLWPGIPYSISVDGPALLSLGDFVSDPIANSGTSKRLKGRGGPFRRFGFTDKTTADQVLLLAKERAWPDFTVAYFPDNDYLSHSKGPAAALCTVENVDRVIGQLIALYGGCDSLLESMAIIVTGDHAQSDLPFGKKTTDVAMDKILDGHAIVPAGANWRQGDELMICPNMRAAQIYRHPQSDQVIKQIVTQLLDDDRIDQVIWRDDDCELGQAGLRFNVHNHGHGSLVFGANAEIGQCARDEYATQWYWQGNLAVIDAHVNECGSLEFGKYPNALERIATAFDELRAGDLWVTAKPGFEFSLSDTGVHRRGSHGSLHADDSLSPLFVSGIPKELHPPKTPRSVDVAPLVLSALGIESARAVGASHVDSAVARKS